MPMIRTLGAVAIAIGAALPVETASADVGVSSAAARTVAERLAISEEARSKIAEFQLRDVHPVNQIIILDNTVLPLKARTLIDARIVTIVYVNKARYTPRPYGATTGEAIDTWTGTVLLGQPSGYGTSLDQSMAMIWMLGPV